MRNASASLKFADKCRGLWHERALKRAMTKESSGTILRGLLFATVFVAILSLPFSLPAKLWFAIAGFCFAALVGCIFWADVRRNQLLKARGEVEDFAAKRRRLVRRWLYFAIVVGTTAIMASPALKFLPPFMAIVLTIVLVAAVVWASQHFSQTFAEPEAPSRKFGTELAIRTPTLSGTIDILTWSLALAAARVVQNASYH